MRTHPDAKTDEERGAGMFWEARWRRVPTVGTAAATRSSYATPALWPWRVRWSGRFTELVTATVVDGVFTATVNSNVFVFLLVSGFVFCIFLILQII
jgi:hypothetical protein